MTRGAVIFAHNNNVVNYVSLAEFCASRVKQFLGIPVTLITTDKVESDIFDKIIEISPAAKLNSKLFYDGMNKNQKLPWNNLTRSDVFDLTPYNETLVLDSDYIINSDFLIKEWENTNEDIRIYKDSFDLGQWREQKEFLYLSDHSIPFYWATVFWFRKTDNTESFFTLVKHIKENWYYYKSLYHIKSTNFRNDYAFSIALHMLNGFSETKIAGTFSRKHFFSRDVDHLLNVSDNKIQLLIQKEQSEDYIFNSISETDVHIMNKFSLLRFIDGQK
jgi:hypothetical protein